MRNTWKNRGPKNFIDTDGAIELFEGFGFVANKFNYYQIRIKPEESQKMYDWYHTRGTLTVISNGKTARVGSFKEAEQVAEFIKKHQYD